jgi:hypothetical protein
MWGARYWGVRYWGTRYWGKVGAVAAAIGRTAKCGYVVPAEVRGLCVPRETRGYVVPAETRGVEST